MSGEWRERITPRLVPGQTGQDGGFPPEHSDCAPGEPGRVLRKAVSAAFPATRPMRAEIVASHSRDIASAATGRLQMRVALPRVAVIVWAGVGVPIAETLHKPFTWLLG